MTGPRSEKLKGQIRNQSCIQPESIFLVEVTLMQIVRRRQILYKFAFCAQVKVAQG